ncbi:MAG: hypothetical protein MR945_11420 [Agathobacter sp.]|nr:hypothetical protein [Agathobacter sp.]
MIRKWHKIPKSCAKNPYLLGKRAKNGEKILVYVGNGAEQNLYDRLSVYTGEKYEICSPAGGVYHHAALYRIKERNFPEIVNGFVQEKLQFAGFYARRRTDEGWEWLCEDGCWHLTSSEMPDKRLLQEGESSEVLFESSQGVVILVAQWENESGCRCDCGHQMFSNKLMAHAFGGMNGKTYHNTMPALEQGVKNGYRYFETDLSYTVDGRLVLCHGWTEANCKHTGLAYRSDFKFMTYRRIMKMKVHGNPIINARSFFRWMKKNPQYTFEIDFHNIAGEEVKNRVAAMLADCRGMKNEKIPDRLLIQAYSRQMYEDMDAVYHFKHYQYLVGKNIHDLDEIITYALDQGICVLALRTNLAKPRLVRKIRNAGLYVMCYTVNQDLAVAQKLLDSGVNTLCTDFITEKMLQANTQRLGNHPFYVYYNSGAADAVSHYTVEEERMIERVGSGNLEYKDQRIWGNDGTQSLCPCRYEVAGKQFVGWHLRVRVDGKQLWYCQDHMYHSKGDFVEGTQVMPYIFADEEIIPKWTLKENMKLIMVAVWK